MRYLTNRIIDKVSRLKMNGGNVVSLEQEIKASLTRGVVGKLDMLAIYQDTNLLRRIVCELAKPFYGKVD